MFFDVDFLYENAQDGVEQYKKTFTDSTPIDLVEKYCIANKLLYAKDDTISIFSKDPFNDAKTLANSLFESTGNMYIRVATVIKNQEMVVHYNFVTVAKVFRMRRTVSDVYIAPSEFVLIEKYHALYQNEEVDLTDMEQDKALVPYKPQLSIAESRATNIELLAAGEKVSIGTGKRIVYSTWSFEMILLGYWAYRQITGNKSEYFDQGPVQCISSTPAIEIQAELEQSFGTCKYTTLSADIPEDPRLTRTLFTVNGKTILEVYNSTTYELVPAKKYTGQLVAHPYVCLRFAYADLFTHKNITKYSPALKLLFFIITFFRKTKMPVNKKNFHGTHETKGYYIKSLDTMLFPYYPYAAQT